MRKYETRNQKHKYGNKITEKTAGPSAHKLETRRRAQQITIRNGDG